MTINSRNKGATGEREFASFLREHGYEARRGQQFSGSPDSPDVVCHSLPYHFEVKRTERFNAYDAIEQAKRDCGVKTPVVAHRRNHHEWLVVMKAEDFMELLAGIV